MRLLVLAAAAALPAGSAAAPAPGSEPVPQASRAQPLPGVQNAEDCRKAGVHQADRSGPVQFRRLDELPQARGYMAVYRTVDGCEVPMTVVEYRQGLGR